MLTSSISLIRSQRVFDIVGSHRGFTCDDKIYNLNLDLVGVVKNNKAYSLLREYIGDLLPTNDGCIIAIESDEYPDQEPVWVSQKNRIMLLLQKSIMIDTSFRFFGF